MDVDGGKRVFQRLGPSNSNANNNKQQKVCFHWRAGKCSRFPCPYLHRELPLPPQQQQSHMGNGTAASSKRPHGFADEHSNMPRRNSNFNNTWGRVPGGGRGGGVVRKTEKVCNFWVQGNCSYGERCRYIHGWCTGAFSLLTQLEGHQKVVSGIALPFGSDKLYTGSKDETVRVWDCQSGQCAGVINLAGEVGCILSEGPWVFVGLPNVVKAWNAQTATDLSLSGPVGQVYALVVGNDLLFAGTQDGTILAWKFNVVSNSFEPAASLKGHSLAVVTLVVGANRLYSGSMDNSIRVWGLETLQCMQTLTEHTSVVMSVLCWDQFLLSCSLDKTIKNDQVGLQSMQMLKLSELVKRIEEELGEAKSSVNEKQHLYENCVTQASLLEKSIHEHANNREGRLKDLEKKIKTVKGQMQSALKDLKDQAIHQWPMEQLKKLDHFDLTKLLRLSISTNTHGTKVVCSYNLLLSLEWWKDCSHGEISSRVKTLRKQMEQRHIKKTDGAS